MVRSHLQEIRKARRARARARFAESKKVYNSRRWQRIRRRVLLRDVFCRRGCGELAAHVDHIVDIANGGDPYDLDNLQALCARCHGQKTAGK